MISILFGIIVGLANYYSKPFCEYCYKYKAQLVSFSGGISLTYLIFKLLITFSKGAAQIRLPLYLTILFGFVIFYLIEKYIYKHYPKGDIRKEIKLEDSTVSFIAHFILGMFIATFTKVSVGEGILFTIPTLFLTAIRTLPFDPEHSKPVVIMLSSSTLLGVLFVEYLYPTLNLLIYHALLGFVIGSLLFVITRHSLPFGKKGEPLYFIIGVIAYIILILWINRLLL